MKTQPVIDATRSPPACPITGEPASRLIQRVSSRLLQGLWLHGFGVDTGDLLGRVKRFELWESPCGLWFFAPMIVGDNGFYNRLYERFAWHDRIAATRLRRPEFSRAAARVPDGGRVLDVGAGKGGFARFVPHARYVGLEPNDYAMAGTVDIRNETVERHALAHAGAYDAACAFQVIEHVADPLGFATAMVTCLKPGGRLILGVPCHPSPLTEIPNYVINAPPHHMSLWNARALGALADRLGLIVETVEGVPAGSHDSLLYWMGRLSPPLTGPLYFRAHKLWYMALAWAWLAGRVANILLRVPEDGAPMTLLLSARRPG